MSAKQFWDRVLLVSGGQPSPWGESLGIAKTTISSWKKGAGTPQAGTLKKLSERTGIPVAWWLRGEGEIPPEAARRFGLPVGEALTPKEAPSPQRQSKGKHTITFDNFELLAQTANAVQAGLEATNRNSLPADQYGAIFQAVYDFLAENPDAHAPTAVKAIITRWAA